MRQRTLAAPVEFSGVGIHTGCAARVRLLPAPAGHGVRFRSRGLEIPAVAERVENVSRCTMLGGISTVEHLLAALYGLAIDNVLAEVEGPEIPILDGSAWPFVDSLLDAGVETQDALARTLKLERPIWLNSNGGACVLAFPADDLTVTAAIDFNRPLAGPQIYSFSFGALPRFARELAPARTFCFEDEVAAIRAMGLGRGGSPENTVVVSDTGTSTPLRYVDELARHKALDLLGDLALVGVRLAAHVCAVRAGHALHAAMAGEIRKLLGNC